MTITLKRKFTHFDSFHAHSSVQPLGWMCRPVALSGPRRHQGPRKRESFSASCSTSSLLTVKKTLRGLQYPCSPVQWSTLPPSVRYLHGATRSAWTPAKLLTLFLSARERHREIRVCLLQFCFHLKITGGYTHFWRCVILHFFFFSPFWSSHAQVSPTVPKKKQKKTDALRKPFVPFCVQNVVPPQRAFDKASPACCQRRQIPA